MKCLVTGVNGFVGSALAKKMLDNDDFQVCGVVRKGKRGLFDAETNIDLIEVPALDGNTCWEDIIDGVDVVVHLAARVHVMHDVAMDPLNEFRKINLEATKSIAKAAATKGVKRFVFLSSVKVNGEGGWKKVYAESDKETPTDPYSLSKWEAEQALRQIESDSGLELVILRSPLVYGPGVKANFLRMMELVNRNIPLPFSLIKNQRSLIYLGNLVDAIITCLKHPIAAGKTYMVSDGYDVSTPMLIQEVAKALGKKACLLPFPVSIMKILASLTGKKDVINRLVNSLAVENSKICSDLDWQPPYKVEEGIYLTAQWFKEVKKDEEKL